MSAQIPSHPTPVYLVINAGGSDLKLLGSDKKLINIGRDTHQSILDDPCQWPTELSHFRPLILSHFSR